jgi:hypothetical protein
MYSTTEGLWTISVCEESAQERRIIHLCSDCVRTSGEEFGDAGSLEAQAAQAKGSTQTGTSSAHNKCIVFVINNRIITRNLENKGKQYCYQSLLFFKTSDDQLEILF